MIHKSGLHPNLRTFANLAIECTKMDDGLQLLKDLEVKLFASLNSCPRFLQHNMLCKMNVPWKGIETY